MSLATEARMLEAVASDNPLFAGIARLAEFSITNGSQAMGMHALVEDQKQTAVDAAIEKANRWTEAAAPIVKALFLVEDAESECRRGCDDQTSREARSILGEPQRELREMLDGIRDNFLADQLPPQPGPGASEAEWDARDEFHDEVCREVTTVDALIRKMEREA